jgi:hypothetical protein
MNGKHGKLAFALGGVLAVALLAGLAELYLRGFPPRDLHPYLGEASPLTGLYRPDADFAVTYRSFRTFYTDNAPRLGPLPLKRHNEGRPLWAFFGNSFVQAPGMLADHARANVKDHNTFNLGRNEHLFVRMAQIKLLLDKGLKPERIFFNLMPTDVLILGEQPLDSIVVTSQGALTYRPTLPQGPLGLAVEHCQLMQTAWFRAGQQKGNRSFNKNRIYERIDEPLLGDLRRLFGNLARVTKEHEVPVTILLTPAYHQIHCGASCAFQETLIPMFREQGFDVFFPIDAFRSQPDTASLFIPDRHFSPRGNRVLLNELLAHVRSLDEASQP